jgi:hypothetical protein
MSIPEQKQQLGEHSDYVLVDEDNNETKEYGCKEMAGLMILGVISGTIMGVIAYIGW